MRISDWSSDLCSSDLTRCVPSPEGTPKETVWTSQFSPHSVSWKRRWESNHNFLAPSDELVHFLARSRKSAFRYYATSVRMTNIGRISAAYQGEVAVRSEEHTYELQSLMRISYDVFCLKKKK